LPELPAEIERQAKVRALDNLRTPLGCEWLPTISRLISRKPVAASVPRRRELPEIARMSWCPAPATAFHALIARSRELVPCSLVILIERPEMKWAGASSRLLAIREIMPEICAGRPGLGPFGGRHAADRCQKDERYGEPYKPGRTDNRHRK